MGAVASFVSDVVEGVGDFVGDVVEAVGDVVEDVVDFVGDVVEKVGDVVEAVVNDPLPVLLSVAGQMVGIPAPVTMAALTAARGGDLQDIVLSAGTAYFAPTVANSLSATFAPALMEAVGSETIANVVAESTSKALVSGTIAEIKGGDFEDGFAGAFTGSIVNSSIGEFTNEFIRPDIVEMAQDNGIDIKTANQFVTGTQQAFSAGLSAEIRGGDFSTAFTNSVTNQTVNAGTNYATNSIGDQFKSIGDGWDLAEEEDKEGYETTITTDATGAGISDDLVNQVEVADMGTDSGDSTTTLANNVPTGDLGDLYSAPEAEDAETLAAEFGMDQDLPKSSVEVVGLPADYDFADYVSNEEEEPSTDVAETSFLDDMVAKSSAETPVTGGLTAITPEGEKVTDEDVSFYAGKPTAVTEDSVIDTMGDETVAKRPEEDIYAGLDMGITPMGEDKPVDIAGMEEKPSGGGLNSLVASTGITPASIGAGILNQVVRPVIKTGLTKALTRTPVRKPVQRKATTQLAAPKQLTGAQLQAARAKQTGAPVNKAVPTQVAKTATPKKVDVSTLTPITNISGLTAMLAKNKGQG